MFLLKIIMLNCSGDNMSPEQFVILLKIIILNCSGDNMFLLKDNDSKVVFILRCSAYRCNCGLVKFIKYCIVKYHLHFSNHLHVCLVHIVYGFQK